MCDPSFGLQEGPRRRMGFGFSFSKVPSYKGNSEIYLQPSACSQCSAKCRLVPGLSPALSHSSDKPHWAEREEGRGFMGRAVALPASPPETGDAQHRLCKDWPSFPGVWKFVEGLSRVLPPSLTRSAGPGGRGSCGTLLALSSEGTPVPTVLK